VGFSSESRKNARTAPLPGFPTPPTLKPLFDFNGDGFTDIAVGAHRKSSTILPFNGSVHIFYGPLGSGSTRTDEEADVILHGESSLDQFGSSLAPIGDFDGDGYDDLIVGAPHKNNSTGCAYIVFGREDLRGTHSISEVAFEKIRGLLPSRNLGHQVSGTGDVNGDGLDDVVVGAPGDLNALPMNNTFVGRAHVFFGSKIRIGTRLVSQANWTLLGEGINHHMGQAVGGAGDVNQDGLMDIIVGAPYAMGQAGRAYIIFGSRSRDPFTFLFASSNGVTRINSASPGSIFGLKVSGAGDVNGDGVDDFMVGSGHNDQQNRGKAYIFFGPISNNQTIQAASADVQVTGAPQTFLSSSLIPVGDVNGDGIADIILGAPYAALGLTFQTGEAWLLPGGSNLPAELSVENPGNALKRIFGTSFGDLVGSQLAPAGDINDDGIRDFIVGVTSDDNDAGSNAGRACIILGTSQFSNSRSLDSAAEINLFGTQSSGYFGTVR